MSISSGRTSVSPRLLGNTRPIVIASVYLAIRQPTLVGSTDRIDSRRLTNDSPVLTDIDTTRLIDTEMRGECRGKREPIERSNSGIDGNFTHLGTTTFHSSTRDGVLSEHVCHHRTGKSPRICRTFRRPSATTWPSTPPKPDIAWIDPFNENRIAGSPRFGIAATPRSPRIPAIWHRTGLQVFERRRSRAPARPTESAATCPR